MTIEGKVVAITGASSGIGAAVARHLSERGARVVLGARDQNRLDTAAEAIRAAGWQCAAQTLDVARLADVKRFVATAGDAFGRLDVLVSNAGVMPIGPMEELATDSWMQMVDVNLKGVLNGVAAALPVFLQQGHGHFIHTASTAARKVVPGQAVYAATKAAVLALSDGLRQELAGRVRVTVVSPGFTATNFTEQIRDADLRARMEQSRDALAMPPETVARAIAYALEQPDEVNVGEMVVRPAAQP